MTITMTIKSFFAFSALALTSLPFLAGPASASPKGDAQSKAKTVQLDAAKSQLKWTGKKVTGQHNGTIALKSGELQLDGQNIKGGKFEIDMSSIVVEDIQDKGYNAKLTGHLKSDDFFGVDKYPVSVFKIKSVKPLKDNKEATHEISGDLTVKGATHPVKFPAQVEFKDGTATAKGRISIDRTKYGIKYGSGRFFDNLGDKMINDEFVVDLEVAATI